MTAASLNLTIYTSKSKHYTNTQCGQLINKYANVQKSGSVKVTSTKQYIKVEILSQITPVYSKSMFLNLGVLVKGKRNKFGQTYFLLHIFKISYQGKI